MFTFNPKSTIDQLVQEKEEGRIKISSILVKRKIFPCFERVSEKEISFSGATKDEFLDYLRSRGAKQIENSQKVFERI